MVWLARYPMATAPATALNSLIASPETFLKLYPVRIFGATVPLESAQYALDNRGASMPPRLRAWTHKWHATMESNSTFRARRRRVLHRDGGVVTRLGHMPLVRSKHGAGAHGGTTVIQSILSDSRGSSRSEDAHGNTASGRFPDSR